MAKTTITTHDPLIYLLRTREESIDLFGEDDVNETGIEVPDELIVEFNETYQKLLKLSREAEEYYKKQRSSNG